MTPESYAAAVVREFTGGDGRPLEPRWREHPPGVLRAFGWYVWQEVEAMTAQIAKGKIPPLTK